MNSFGNFLWKLFSATMVFLCHLGSNGAVAEETTIATQYIADDPKMTSAFFKSTSNVNHPKTKRLCPSGQYLYACGAANIGTYWLKGMTKTKNMGSTGAIQTPDYYSYDTENSDTIHMENLRKFFAHNEPITFRSRTGSSGNYTFSNVSVSASTYTPYLYQMLSNFCTNEEGQISDIHCKKCPNNASVERSTVKADSYVTGKILWDSWNVHTIADCYMNEFSDEEGTYIYIAENVQDNTNGTNCYYNKNVYGTELYYE